VLPDDLFDRLTPTRFVLLFCQVPPARLDPVEELTRVNRERGKKGLRPVVPSWLVG
jgi:hypothetical protein